ncbi:MULTISPECIES: WXG100 family type VII secretion target [Streptomyces]|uniref:WXG100 family type VII secretion target n=1 Tax=Streptomyces spirodelae TaxID=2812904 RepID=A0ABS3WVU3_9ACTN|nr:MULTISPECIES: WXG100 family type VII secretion target [Streptomyces]MBO8187173.1 WXG100 family type VII secretion target [Streptomyces spirodelae]UNZ16614.1 WXG100 family type VII secretion target [Streptomyces sp. 891-h]
MGMNGADLERLRELAGKFDGDANTLQGLITSLQSACNDSGGYWTGGKAQQFRSEWEGLKPTFDKFVETLREAGTAARTNADNIDHATN